MSLIWVHPQLIHLMWLAVAVVAILAVLEVRGREALGRFVSTVMQHRLAHRLSTERRVARLVLVFAMLVTGILALMRPQTRGQVETLYAGGAGGDIMIVMDVSRSMLADDAPPYRLARAKAEVSSMVDELDGHRVGLVAFAGRAAVLCPLTGDYGFFRMILRGVDTNSAARGGTDSGVALKTAVDACGPEPGSKVIVLITDGEDHSGYARESAGYAKEHGVRLVTVGFGSEEGSEITLVDPETGRRDKLTDSTGTIVVSRVDGELLREIALETEGVYVPAGVAGLDLDAILEQHIEPMVRESAKSTRRVPGEQYPWLVLASLVFLVAAVWAGSAGSPRRQS